MTAKQTDGERRIRFGRFGLLENPVGLCVTWNQGERIMLADVIGTYRREHPQAIMLTVRHFNGEDAPDIAASAVRVLEPTEVQS